MFRPQVPNIEKIVSGLTELHKALNNKLSNAFRDILSIPVADQKLQEILLFNMAVIRAAYWNYGTLGASNDRDLHFMLWGAFSRDRYDYSRAMGITNLSKDEFGELAIERDKLYGHIVEGIITQDPDYVSSDPGIWLLEDVFPIVSGRSMQNFPFGSLPFMSLLMLELVGDSTDFIRLKDREWVS